MDIYSNRYTDLNYWLNHRFKLWTCNLSFARTLCSTIHGRRSKPTAISCRRSIIRFRTNSYYNAYCFKYFGFSPKHILKSIISKTKRNRFRQRSVCNYKGLRKNEACAKNLRTQGFYLIIYLLFKQEEIFFLRKTAHICA